MTQAQEKIFEAIATNAIEHAEQVDCDGPVFVEGLKAIIDSIVHRWEGARSEFGDDPDR